VVHELVGTEVRTRRRVDRRCVCEVMTDVAAMVIGIGFPAMFFLLSVMGAIDVGTALSSPSGQGWPRSPWWWISFIANCVVTMILGGQMREIKPAAAITSQQTGSRWHSATVP
jgi:formate-dependent nitrite reductase membrane component NrfD